MSGHGAPAPQQIDATGLRVVVVAGLWHDVITDGLIAGAERVLEQSGADWRLVRVPGSFELPVAAKAALDAGADAVVALGVIIRGGTPHFEFVSAAATSVHNAAPSRPPRSETATDETQSPSKSNASFTTPLKLRTVGNSIAARRRTYSAARSVALAVAVARLPVRPV